MNKIRLSLFVLVALVVAGSSLFAQSVEEGRKFYYYERYESAKNQFEKVLQSNPKNEEAIYWLGQTLIDDNDSLAAKDLYQKALMENGNSPLLLAGMGHVELLEGKVNDARQRFETAISLSKGKDVDVFNAVGKANAQTRLGDANYAIEKLTQATNVRRFKNPYTYLYMGDAYRKLVDGGGAITSYRKALELEPGLAAAEYRIGRIYLTQNNSDYFIPAFERAVLKDPQFAPAYYELFYYWYSRDINKAAEYFDKYLAVADKKHTDEYDRISIIYARKAFQDAINAAKQKIEANPNDDPRYYKLIAYSYDELKDSVNALEYLNQYFSRQKEGDFVPMDYVFKAKLLSKFPGNEDKISDAYTQAIDLDTAKANKIKYATEAANLMAKAKKYQRQIDWMAKTSELKGDKLSEFEYYTFCKAVSDAISASNDTTEIMELYPMGDSITNAYITAFPDKPQGYSYRVLIAKKADKDTTLGLAIEPMEQQNAYLLKEGSESGKKTAFSNYYYMLFYYTQYVKDMTRVEGYKKAIEVAGKMMELYPDTNSEENKFAAQTRNQLQGALDKFEKSQQEYNEKVNRK